jgi:phospholipid transport system substrate-binding protein
MAIHPTKMMIPRRKTNKGSCTVAFQSFGRKLFKIVAFVLAMTIGQGVLAQSDMAADEFVKTFSNDLLQSLKAQKSTLAGDVNKISALVDQRVMPHVNFQRMTASAVGPGWRQATPEQQKRLQQEFKTLLVRTYAGAVAQVGDLSITLKPLRASPDDKEVLVRTEVRGNGDPIQLDYRVEKAADAPMGWRIYNLNVMGIWLVDNYRSQFAQEVNSKGIDGLINDLAERNKANSKNSK